MYFTRSGSTEKNRLALGQSRSKVLRRSLLPGWQQIDPTAPKDGTQCVNVNECDLGTGKDLRMAQRYGLDVAAQRGNQGGIWGSADQAGGSAAGGGKGNLLSDKCHEYAECVDTPGSYTCKCLPGYFGDGFKECVREMSNNTECVDSACEMLICKEGFRDEEIALILEGSLPTEEWPLQPLCRNIDECEEGNDDYLDPYWKDNRLIPCHKVWFDFRKIFAAQVLQCNA